MSSQSIVHKPEAPVAPFDLGIFSKVLMYKQAKFDQGADAVQNQINQLQNQQVIGETQKKYLQDKINSTIEGVNSMGGLDFSDRNVLNQTSGYINEITKDPIITSAITNTRAIQKGVAYFDKLKQDAASGKKGVYYNPANEYDYMENVNDYVRRSQTDVKAAYNDRPIAPPVDVNKALMTAAKDVVASTYTEADGTNKYILKTGKIVTADRLYQYTLDQIQTDPNLANQVRINAKYNYLQKDANGNINPAQLQNLKQTYLQSNANKISSIQNELVDLAKQKAATSDSSAQIRIQSQIDDTSKELEKYIINQDSRTSEIDQILATNPEAAAANVYSNKLLEGIVAARAFREEKVQYNQAEMFVDKMNLEANKEAFNQDIETQKLALETTKVAIAAREADANGNPTGEILSEEVSLPTNLRKSSQDVMVDQARAVDMQKANVQQDYYHYIYQFKNDGGLVTKVGNNYVPTEKFKEGWNDNMKKLKDLRDGKTLPAPLDPEFIKMAIKYQELDLVKNQYVNTITDVNREALEQKRKSLGLSDSDYTSFLKGKALVAQLPDIMVPTLGASKPVTTKDYSKLPSDPESKKAFDIYKKFNSQMSIDPEIIERIYNTKGSQVIPRTSIPIGLKEADLKARSNALVGLINRGGYYSVDGSEKPEKTAKEDLSSENIRYLGDTYMNLGDGFRPYVKAQIDSGTGEKKTTKTVFIDADDTYISNFRNFAQNVNEAARQQVLREGKVTFDSASEDGRNVIQTQVIKNSRGLDDESASVQAYITRDANGKLISPQAVNLNLPNMNISQATTLAKNFAQMYSDWYKKAALTGQPKNKLRVTDFIDQLNKVSK